MDSERKTDQEMLGLIYSRINNPKSPILEERLMPLDKLDRPAADYSKVACLRIRHRISEACLTPGDFAQFYACLLRRYSHS